MTKRFKSNAQKRRLPYTTKKEYKKTERNEKVLEQCKRERDRRKDAEEEKRKNTCLEKREENG